MNSVWRINLTEENGLNLDCKKPDSCCDSQLLKIPLVSKRSMESFANRGPNLRTGCPFPGCTCLSYGTSFYGVDSINLIVDSCCVSLGIFGSLLAGSWDRNPWARKRTNGISILSIDCKLPFSVDWERITKMAKHFLWSLKNSSDWIQIHFPSSDQDG